jgi:succinate-acetate transporter protein
VMGECVMVTFMKVRRLFEVFFLFFFSFFPLLTIKNIRRYSIANVHGIAGCQVESVQSICWHIKIMK